MNPFFNPSYPSCLLSYFPVSQVLPIKTGDIEGREAAGHVADAVSKERNLWLSVLLEILIKLCDIRDNDTCLEPGINFATANERSYKKKGNGLRRLKGPDVGTEEWGNLSDDLGNGSGSGSDDEAYSSSDESIKGSYNRSHVVTLDVYFRPLFCIMYRIHHHIERWILRSM